MSTVKPANQRQVQDTVTAMYQRTANALPSGYSFDGSRYGTTGGIVDCDDDAKGDEVSPVQYRSSRDMKVPAGTPIDGLVEKLGEIWKSFGWSVDQRDGFPEPNRFATTSDGYRIHAIVGRPAGYPPVLVAGSFCYDGHLVEKGIEIPAVVRSPQ